MGEVTERRPWSWRPAAGWAATVCLGLGLLVLLSDQAITPGLVAAASNGLVVFFLIAGTQAAATHRYRPWRVPLAAGAGTAATVLPLRLAASVTDVGGPFGDVADTLLDVGWRTGAVVAVVAVTERWTPHPDEGCGRRDGRW